MKDKLQTFGIPALVGFLMYSPLMISGYYGSKIRDIGEDFRMVEIGRTQVRYNYQGMTYIDYNGDGKLDQTCKLMPISPMMGGPGWVLMDIPIKNQDYTNFDRAKQLSNDFKRDKK